MNTTRRASRRLLDGVAGLRQAYESFITHRSLKSLLLAGLIAHLVIFAFLVATAVTGTSIGLLHPPLFAGADADLLAGDPQPIRSDEWYVATPLKIGRASCRERVF